MNPKRENRNKTDEKDNQQEALKRSGVLNFTFK